MDRAKEGEKKMENKIIKTMEELNIFIDEFDNYCFNSDESTVFFRNSYSHYADQEHKVEGEALAFLLEEEAEEKAHEEEESRKLHAILEAEAREEEEYRKEIEAQAFKEKNGGFFVFKCDAVFAEFEYDLFAKSLDDAIRIGWEELAKEGLSKKDCYYWDCR